VRQILINIISNSVKYTEKGEIHVSYETRTDDVRVCVADTGIGIPPAKQRLLYQSFLEPSNNLSASYDGTGIGLVLIKSLLHMMKGKIWIETNDGGGTKFYFTLPLA
jgi:signal transduction histidine kinase